jgi:phosphate:Na+ symporter
MGDVQMWITIIGGLALFLFGMKVMGEGLQRVAGPRMRKILSAMTANRFLGVGTGLAVTCAVQSSSATTVMLVGFVHAGLITLTESIGVIMGANIGTTFTGWLVALLGFKVKISALALPAVSLGILPRVTGLRKLFDWGDILVGFGILFLGLAFMKDSVSDLKDSETIIGWMSASSAHGLGWRVVAVGVGTLVTVVVQSSSATMAITMTLAAQGLIDLPTACALVLGENIGTTITANLATLSASRTAKRAARAHLLFNVTGVVWAVLLFTPFMVVVGWIVSLWSDGGGDPSAAVIATTLATFHSLFNVTNTCLFLPFVSQTAWLASRMVRAPEDGEEELGLKYLNPSVVQTVPMALHAARSEFGHMIAETQSMLENVITLTTTQDKKLGKLSESITASEAKVDFLERGITEYLATVMRQKASVRQSREMAGILNAVSDVERIGDHCESLQLLAQRRYDMRLRMSENAIVEIGEIGEEAAEFLELLQENLNSQSDDLMVQANAIENSIDTMRTEMRKEHIRRLREGACNVDTGLIFIDMLTSFEKIGDHAYNVAEMLAGER